MAVFLLTGAALAFAQFYPCRCTSLTFLNEASEPVSVSVSQHGEGLLWKGQLAPSSGPVSVKVATYPTELSYDIEIRDQNGGILVQGRFGYDDPLVSQGNLFVLNRNYELSYYSWIKNGPVDQVADILRYGFGEFVSCPLRKMGLSPASIPASL